MLSGASGCSAALALVLEGSSTGTSGLGVGRRHRPQCVLPSASPSPPTTTWANCHWRDLVPFSWSWFGVPGLEIQSAPLALPQSPPISWARKQAPFPRTARPEGPANGPAPESDLPTGPPVLRGPQAHSLSLQLHGGATAGQEPALLLPFRPAQQVNDSASIF